MSILTVISEAHKKYNFESSVSRLRRVKNVFELGKVGRSVHAACDESKGGTTFYMSKEQKDEFWAAYNAKKAEYNEKVKQELTETIPGLEVEGEIKQIKKQIYAMFVLSIDEKKVFYNLCDERIQELAA